MSKLKDLQGKINIVSVTPEKEKRSPKPNYSDEQLALRQEGEKVEIPNDIRDFLSKVLRDYVQLIAFYKKHIPLDEGIDEDVVKLFWKHSKRTIPDALKSIVTEIVDKKCESGELSNDTPLKDGTTLNKYIHVIMLDRIRELNRL